MSEGFRADKGLFSNSWLGVRLSLTDMPPNPINGVVEFLKVLLLSAFPDPYTGIPSITMRGLLPSGFSVLSPRMVIAVAEPGTPELDKIFTPAALPMMALSKDSAGVR